MQFPLVKTILVAAILFTPRCFSQPYSPVYPAAIPKDSIALRNTAYIDIIFHHLNETMNYDSALFYSDMGLQEFQKDDYYRARMLRFRGIYYDYVSEEDSCMFYFAKSLKYALSEKDYDFQTSIYIDYGIYFNVRNTLDSATYYYLKAAEANRFTDNALNAGVIQNNLGLIKMRQGDYDVARDYFLESITCYKKCTDMKFVPQKTMSSYINLTNCFRKLGEYAKANVYCDKAIDLSIHQQDTLAYIENLSMKGLILISMEKYAISLGVSHKAYALIDEEQHPAQIPLLYNFVEGYRGIGLYDSSLFYNQLGIKQSRNHRDSLSFYQNFERTYAQMGDYKNAYFHLKTYSDMADRDASLAEFQSVEEMEQKYRSTRKAHEIELLKREAKIQRLNMILLISLFLFILFVGYFTYRRRRIKLALELAQQKEKVSTAALVGQEDERKRISNDLHDAVGTSLANMGMRLATYLEKNKPQGEALVELQRLKTSVDATYKEVRTISHDLAPYKIEKEGLKFAIDDLIHNLNTIQKTHFKSTISIQEEQISTLSKSIIYRIIQELTSNICKHAQAKSATLHIESSSTKMTIQVQDNGKGFNQDTPQNGIGLKNVTNRVAYLNGKLEIVAEKDYGVLYTIQIPYKSLLTNA